MCVHYTGGTSVWSGLLFSQTQNENLIGLQTVAFGKETSTKRLQGGVYPF